MLFGDMNGKIENSEVAGVARNLDVDRVNENG